MVKGVHPPFALCHRCSDFAQRFFNFSFSDMRAIGKYKAMVDEVGRMMMVFANMDKFPILEQGWTLAAIQKAQTGIMNYANTAADQIRGELIGDGDEAKFKGRLKTAFFELGADPNFALSYFPVFDEALFELPSKDYPDRNKEMVDALTDVYGSDAGKVMLALQVLLHWANFIVGEVSKMLDEVCKFVGYTPELQEQTQEATNTDSLAVEQQEPQQTVEGQKEKPKRGRPTEPFASKMIDDADGEKLKKMHTILKGKKGKDFALIIWACIKRGWCNKPTYTQVKEEFGDIGSNTGYNRYLNNNTMFTPEEKDGALNSLD